jgi:hypothetical protein
MLAVSMLGLLCLSCLLIPVLLNYDLLQISLDVLSSITSLIVNVLITIVVIPSTDVMNTEVCFYLKYVYELRLKVMIRTFKNAQKQNENLKF